MGGLVVLLLIRTALTGRPSMRKTATVLSHVLALPTFFFGSPWLTTVFGHVDPDPFLHSYGVSLTITFALIAGYPLAMLTVATGNMAAGGTRRR